MIKQLGTSYASLILPLFSKDKGLMYEWPVLNIFILYIFYKIPQNPLFILKFSTFIFFRFIKNFYRTLHNSILINRNIFSLFWTNLKIPNFRAYQAVYFTCWNFRYTDYKQEKIVDNVNNSVHNPVFTHFFLLIYLGTSCW